MIFNKRIPKKLTIFLLLVLFFALFYLVVFYKSILENFFRFKPTLQSNVEKIGITEVPVSRETTSKLTAKMATGDRKATGKWLPKEPTKNQIGSNKAIKIYLPYVQVGGTHISIDLFAPIWQAPASLVFTDIKAYDCLRQPFGGEFYLGYRHLLPETQKLYGVYVSFDRKRTEFGNYFNQITLGAEYWIRKLFIGGNIYKTIGKTVKPADKGYLEKSMSGVDAEIGYEFVEGLTGYIGWYCFGAKEVNTIAGPRARLVYDWSLNNGNRILEIFDKVGFEIGVHRDKPKGTVWYSSVNVRIGWLFEKKNVLSGVSRHMVDPIRQHGIVVSELAATKPATKAEPPVVQKEPDPDNNDNNNSNQTNSKLDNTNQAPPPSQHSRTYELREVSQANSGLNNTKQASPPPRTYALREMPTNRSGE